MSAEDTLAKIREIVRAWPKDDRFFDLAELLGLMPPPPREWR